LKTLSDADDGMVEQVQASLQRLSDRDRRALMVRFAEGKSLKEAAVILGISEDAAQKRTSRALEKLRSSLRSKHLSSSGLAVLLGAPAFSAASATATASIGTPVFFTCAQFLAMAKLKVVAITCAVAALTATPVVLQYLKDEVKELPSVEISPLHSMETSEKEAAAARAESEALRTETASLRSELAAAKAPPTGAPVAPERDALVLLKQRVLNPQNDPKDRLEALRELRDRNGRDAQMAAAMAALARSTTDPAIRADIFRQLNGMRDPSLKPVLIEALQNDASEEVRSEAAETLAGHSDDPAVGALLVAVSRNDADSEVRGQAVESRVKHAPADVLQRIQNDPQATDLEIYHSTTALRKLLGADNAQAALLLNVLKDTKIPELRKDIVEDLGKHYGSIPEVAEWMDHLATNEQDPKVRREAAKFSVQGPK
jgi:DNA-binding CsgD family transcriptional regulator